MKGKKIFTRTRVEALVVLAGVALYVWEGFRLPTFYRVPGVPGPTLFPTILGGIMAAAALWLLFSPKAAGDEEAAPDAGEVPEAGAAARGKTDRLHFYLIWGLLLGYVFWMPSLGFVTASFLLLSALFFLLGERRWYVGIPLAAVFSLLIYLAFQKGLQVRLPAGILEGLLG